MEDRAVKRRRRRWLLLGCLVVITTAPRTAAYDSVAAGIPHAAAAPPAFNPVREPVPRQPAATLVSRQTSPRDLRPRPDVSTITARRFAEQAADLVLRGEQELRRGTLLSAQQSGLQALRMIAEANDYLIGGNETAHFLRQAVAALRESADFAGRFGPVGPRQIARMVRAHETPALKDLSVEQLSGSAAADIYLDFARRRFATVADGNPIAVRALVMLSAAERQQPLRTPLSDATAISLMRAAVQAAPRDPLIANQLGYQLLQQGLRDEAGWVLRHSLSLRPTPAAVRNLAEVLRQKGDLGAARQLIASLEGSVAPQDAALSPQLLQLTPQQFAQVSPPTITPQGSPRPAAAPTRAPDAQAAAAGNATAGDAAADNTAAPAASPGPLDRIAQALSRLWK